MTAADVTSRIEPLLREAGLWRDEFGGGRREWLHQVIELFKPRAKKMAEFVERARFFLTDEIVYDPAAAKKHLSSAGLVDKVRALRAAFAACEPFDQATTEAVLRKTAEENGIGAGALIHAARVAMTGSAASPGIFDVFVLLGRDRVLARLDQLERVLTAA